MVAHLEQKLVHGNLEFCYRGNGGRPITKTDLARWRSGERHIYDGLLGLAHDGVAWGFLADAMPGSTDYVDAAIKRIEAGGGSLLSMHNAAYAFLNGEIKYVYHKHANYQETLHSHPDVIYVPGMNSGFAEIDGIGFGFEICLDHGVGALNMFARPERRRPDVQVILSDYVANTPANVNARPGGYVVHASTHAGVNGVYAVPAAGQMTPLPAAASGTAAGAPLHHWEIDVDFDAGFTLAGTFMEHEMLYPTPPGRKPMKVAPAPAYAPGTPLPRSKPVTGQPFRSRP